MGPNKPIKMFIYQPIYEVDKDGKNKTYLHTKTYPFPYYPAKKGDVFTGEKRVKEFIEMEKHSTSKVVAVRYNYADGTCGVVLADKLIERKEEPKEEPAEPTSAAEALAEQAKEETKKETVPAS